jgi:hypothetical protein
MRLFTPSRDLPDELEAPSVERRFALYRFQLPGLVLLALIPVLALAGAFGESHADAEARAGAIAVRVHHPSRLRFEQITTMDILVTNAGAVRFDTLVVSIDTTYLSRFSGVTLTPSATAPFDVELTDVAPGESRRVHVEMDAMRAGRHRGMVRVSGGGADTATLDIATIVFP